MLYSWTNKVPLNMYTGLGHYKQTAQSSDKSADRGIVTEFNKYIKILSVCVGPIHPNLFFSLMLLFIFFIFSQRQISAFVCCRRNFPFWLKNLFPSCDIRQLRYAQNRYNCTELRWKRRPVFMRDV